MLKQTKNKNFFKRSAFLAIALLIAGYSAFLFYGKSPKAKAADTIVNSGAIELIDENTTGSQNVFISDQIGYAFWEDNTGTGGTQGKIIYSKTTDAGASWGAGVTVDSQTDTRKVAIWYDRWTPGDTTGNIIYIVTTDLGSSDIWYRTLDTSSDTLSTGPTSITTGKTNTLNSSNIPAITKGTDGVLYVSMNDSSSSYILKCSTTCTTAGNWSDAGTNPLTVADSAWSDLIALASGQIMVVEHDDSIDDTHSKIWNGTSWSGSWTAIDSNCIVNLSNSGGLGAMGATVDSSGSTVYIVEACDNVTLGTDDDIRTASYSGGSWTTKTDILTNQTRGVLNTKIARDQNTGDVYVIYSTTASGTPTNKATASLFWKKSTDGMTTWGSEQGSIAGPDDMASYSLNITSDERIYAFWGQDNGAGNDSYNGLTLANLIPSNPPAAPTLITPSAGQSSVGLLPQFKLRTTDSSSDYLRYKIELCSDSLCNTVLQTFDQTLSQTGWSGQDQVTSTAYTGSSTLISSTIATYSIQSALAANTTYYWRGFAKDPGGSNTFSSASSIQSFTTIDQTGAVQINGGTTIQGGTDIR
jgi:hypothetical protein